MTQQQISKEIINKIPDASVIQSGAYIEVVWRGQVIALKIENGACYAKEVRKEDTKWGEVSADEAAECVVTYLFE